MASLGPVRAQVYETEVADPGAVRVRLTEVFLTDVRLEDGQLIGPRASVETRSVLVGKSAGGELFGRAMEPIEPRNGTLCFDPTAGGVRTRENRLAAGAFNDRVAEATRFGMVNAYFHADLAARKLNRLLCEVGAAELPPVHLVVGAHSGSRLSGYMQGDADRRVGRRHPEGRRHPLQGAHYRLSTRTNGVPEHLPVRPSGEIHLGPGRYRGPFAGISSYLRNAAHNPATIYHEFGHHLCRHTADFRLNAERSGHLQRNGKTGPEEGVCDYLAASLIGTGRPYGWYRALRGARRDPEIERGWDPEQADAHAAGAQWASFLWRLRETLLKKGIVESSARYDRALVLALLTAGRVAARPGDRRRRRARAVERAAPATMAIACPEAVRSVCGVDAWELASRMLEGSPFLERTASPRQASAC